jgi:hypothetical protein
MTHFKKGLTKDERHRESRMWIRKYRREQPSYYLCELARKRTEVRSGKVSFDLCPGDVEIPKFCPISGVVLRSGKGQKGADSPTLMRLDPNRGWERGNVLVLSWEAAQTLKWEQEALRQVGDRADWIQPKEDSPETLLGWKRTLEAMGCEAEASLECLLAGAIPQNTRTNETLGRLVERLRKDIL